MSFVHEKQSRRFLIFLFGFWFLLLLFFLYCTGLQTQKAKDLLTKREAAIVSSLLKEGVMPQTAAAALDSTEITPEGQALMKQAGRAHPDSALLLEPIRKQAAGFLAAALLGGLSLGGILLGGSVLFLIRREQLYQKAAATIAEFSEGIFEHHLPRSETGTLYRLFASVDGLAMALEAKSKTEQKSKEFLKDTISDISHQLKTPLAALTMYTEIILEEPDHPLTVKKFARKSLWSLARMEQLIQSLLKVMRLDAGNIIFVKKLCPITELAKQATAELLTRAGMEGKEMLFQGEPSELVFCDPQWTGEAIGNLVKNALDHTESGGTVRIAWNRSPAMVRIFITDNGSGIPQEDIHHIFKRFYRSKHSTDTQGVGLGLPLAKSIIEQQGGLLTLQSTPGQGSTFTISFLTDS